MGYTTKSSMNPAMLYHNFMTDNSAIIESRLVDADLVVHKTSTRSEILELMQLDPVQCITHPDSQLFLSYHIT